MKKLLLITFLVLTCVGVSAQSSKKNHFGFGLGYTYQNTSYLDMGSVPLGMNLSLDAYFSLSDKMFLLMRPQVVAGLKSITFGNNDVYRYELGKSAIPVNLGLNLLNDEDYTLGAYVGYKAAWPGLNYTVTSGNSTSRFKQTGTDFNKLANGLTLGLILVDDSSFTFSLEYVHYLIPSDYGFKHSEISLTYHLWLF